MEIKSFTPDIKEAWDSFVTNTEGGTCYHLSGWKDAFEKTYQYKTYYLFATESEASSNNSNPNIVGILPLVLIKSLLFGRFLVSLPFFDHVGVLTQSKNAEIVLIKKATEIARQESAEFVEFRHHLPILSKDTEGNWYGGELVTEQRKLTLHLELPNTADELWKSFKSKLRSQIKKPMKEGLTAKIGGIEEVDNFYNIFAQNMRDLGTPVNSKWLFKNILLEFPQQAKICIVSKDKKPVAAGFVVGFKEKLHIPWASALKNFNHLSPNMLLYWSILEYACNQKYKIFDFGRSTPGVGTHKSSGIPYRYRCIGIIGSQTGGKNLI
jgi:serine/alanine adding enzyme